MCSTSARPALHLRRSIVQASLAPRSQTPHEDAAERASTVETKPEPEPRCGAAKERKPEVIRVDHGAWCRCVGRLWIYVLVCQGLKMEREKPSTNKNCLGLDSGATV